MQLQSHPHLQSCAIRSSTPFDHHDTWPIPKRFELDFWLSEIPSYPAARFGFCHI